MTVQMTSIASVAFSCSNKRNIVQDAGQSFDSFLKTDTGSSANSTNQNLQISDSDSQNVTKADKQEPTDSISKSDADGSLSEDDAVGKNSAVDETGEEKAETCSETEEKLPEEVLSEILSILNEFVGVLEKHLQTDMQQLTDAAEMIQFGLMDCFDADRVKDLFLQIKHVDASELLTDENLYKSLEQLQNLVSDILENSDLYRLLQQEGFEPESFDIQVYSEQISEFIGQKLQPVQSAETAEVVIEFDNEVFATKQSDDAVNIIADTETESMIAEPVHEEDSGLSSDEHGKQSSGQNPEGLFLQKLVSVAKEHLSESVQNVSGAFDLYDIATQIIDQVKLQIRPDNTRMELQLNPENLGKVELEITSKNGELSAKLNVQNDQVKEAVESQMQVLRETLEAQGLKVENIEVTVAEFGFRFQDEQGNAEQFRQQQRRNGTIHLDDSETEEQSFSDVSEVMKELNGNSVDYVA